MMDFYCWTQSQATALLARDASQLDWDNLAEEIESMGKSDRREIRSRVQKLLEHLLKRDFFYSPDNVRGWRATIDEERNGIELVIEDSPSLRPFVAEALPLAYAKAKSVIERDYGPVPDACPWTVDEVLTP